jgi:hypothetical protein
VLLPAVSLSLATTVPDAWVCKITVLSVCSNLALNDNNGQPWDWRTAVNRNWWWFFAWVVVGAGYGVAVVGALTIGIFVLPIPVVLTVALAKYQPSPHGALGLICGLGFPLLYVAYLNRSYGGPACPTSGTVSLQQPNVVHECVQALDPWPWLAIGVLLVLGGCVAFMLRDRALRSAGSTNPAARLDR